MDLTYIMEYRFRQAPDGSVWTDTSYDYEFWGRYLGVFDRVNVVARALQKTPPDNWKRVDGPSVAVKSLPHYLGPGEYCRKFWSVNQALRKSINRTSAYILRIPSQLCTSVAGYLIEQSHPFGVEVVGDPNEALARGVTSHPLRPIFQWWFSRNQARQCSHAATAAYVSRNLLRQYPPGPFTKFTECSDVTLDQNAFAPGPRIHNHLSPATLVTVATLSQLYKGIDVLLDAMAACLHEGLRLRLVIVGDGKYREMLEQRVVALDLAGHVQFTGSLLAGDPVRRQLDGANLFILPSRTEGMPRALLEAMARGLPCIASSVGGIPDVLSQEDLVPAGDAAALAAKIREVMASEARLDRMSQRNLTAASAYRSDHLSRSWKDIQFELKQRTASFLGNSRS
jgi:glycosyltransferase involved in cell wall biosynthesis